MRQLLAALLEHGYTLLFAAVFLEQIGIPIPSVPVLLAAGALAAAGKISLPSAILVATGASLVGDVPWYWLGRFKGTSVLRLLCRLTLEPDSCVRRTEEVYVKRGPSALLYAKYIPGLSTVAPPLAGVIKMHFGRFLAFDLLGSIFWASGYLIAGWMFGDQLDKLADVIAGTGKWLAVIVAAPIAGWIGWKYWQRRAFLRKLRIARIEPEDLKASMDAGEKHFIVDLRHTLEAGNMILPGAIHMSPAELDDRALEIPFDRDIILYCS